jgi:hypothetical protein
MGWGFCMEASKFLIASWPINLYNMKIAIIILTTLILCFLVFFFYRRNINRRKKSINNEINPEELSKWKKERRKDKTPISLNVEAMGNNVEKSHELWKALSKIVHESKWIGQSQEKIELAAELNTLINENKTNYLELQNLELRIKNELINDQN